MLQSVHMTLETLKLLTEEKIVPLSKLASAPRKYLKGVVRVVDNGNSLGVFLDAKAADELLEDIEASSPEFMTKIERSRKSGRVSLEKIERDLAKDLAVTK